MARLLSRLTQPRRSCFQCVPLWAAKIELESLIVLTQYNPAAKEIWATATGTPGQNRRLGRKTLLLQMINPGADETAATTSISSPGVSGAAGSADKHLDRISDNRWRRSQPQERSGAR
jgi:hypothetical protein